jgi:hypothetical protein
MRLTAAHDAAPLTASSELRRGVVLDGADDRRRPATGPVSAV